MTRKRFELEISDDDDEGAAYLRLPSHPGPLPGVVHRTISLHELIADYNGPDINLDFDDAGCLIGIEVIE